MNEDVANVLKSIRANQYVPNLDEAATKQVIILRILGTLGWDQYDYSEVTPEYDVGGTKVDYALRTDGRNRVFIEAKRAGESLENHQEQLLGYSFRQGVELAVLTNGLSWWMYLPLRTESWEQRRFCVVDILSDDVDVSANGLVEFLSRPRVHSGSAVRSAGNLLDNLRRESTIREALPDAWRSLIAEKDELLMELIDEKVESLLGFKSGPEQIRRFLDDLSESMPSERQIEPSVVRANPTPIQSQPQMPSISTKSIGTQSRSKGVRGKRINGFRFQGESFQVSQWNDLLQTLSEVIFLRHPKSSIVFSNCEVVRETITALSHRTCAYLNLSETLGTTFIHI